MVRVLPVPAPARTHTGPRGASTAADCSGSRPVSAGMGTIMAGRSDTPFAAPDGMWAREHGPIRNNALGRGVISAVTSTENAPALTIYSTTWCGYCRRLKTQLNASGIEYTAIGH